MRKCKYKKKAHPEMDRLRQRLAELERLEKKRAAAAGREQRERSLLYAVFDGLPAFIYLQARDYSIRFANRAFRERFGDPGGRRCYEAISGLTEPCPLCPTFKVFDSCESQTWEWQPIPGQTFQIYDYPFFDMDGTPLVLELGIDISEAKNLEQIRNELFANISHELRTPLMKIQGYVEALHDGLFTDPADCARQLEIIGRNTRRMNRLISDLLELAKLNAHQSFQFQNLYLSEILPDYLIEQELYVQKKERRLRYTLPDVDLQLRIDPGRFIQVLDNLIDNSLKHTPIGGEIRVDAAAGERELRLVVGDTGPGIAAADAPWVFGKFYRGNCQEQVGRSEGLGLGLAIAQSIVEAHEGRIWVESDQQNGGRIGFSLPSEDSGAITERVPHFPSNGIRGSVPV